MYIVLNLYFLANLGDIYYIMTQRLIFGNAIVMLHVLHVIQIIEVLLYIEAMHVKALHFKANCMDFFKK